jgi:hypothetical protein
MQWNAQMDAKPEKNKEVSVTNNRHIFAKQEGGI